MLCLCWMIAGQAGAYLVEKPATVSGAGLSRIKRLCISAPKGFSSNCQVTNCASALIANRRRCASISSGLVLVRLA